MLACLIKRATFILGYANNFQTVLNLIRQHSPTHIRFSIKDLMAFSQLNAVEHSMQSIQRCDFSGDIVPREVLDKVNHLLVSGELISSYAMSECGTIAINACTQNKHLQHFTGKVIEEVKYKIIDENSLPVPLGEIGELVIKTSTMFKKYLHDAAETQKSFTEDGWFKTGDFFSQEENGFLAFHGRKKNIIIRDGKNINPAYIRQIILEWPDILDCLVTSAHCASSLQVPIAYCTIKANYLAAENFKSYLATNLNPIWLPKAVYVVKNLPRTVFGKIDLAYIRKNAQKLIDQSIMQIAFE